MVWEQFLPDCVSKVKTLERSEYSFAGKFHEYPTLVIQFATMAGATGPDRALGWGDQCIKDGLETDYQLGYQSLRTFSFRNRH